MAILHSHPPPPPTPTFILSFLPSFSPRHPSLHCGAALICIEEEPPLKASSFLPCSSLFTLTASSLLFLSVSFYSCSLPPFIFCLISSIFQIFKWGCSIFFFNVTCSSMLTSSLPPLVTPPPPTGIAIHCTNQSISISYIPFLLSSILSWTRNKAASHYAPHYNQTPTYPSVSDWAWLVNLPEAFRV